MPEQDDRGGSRRDNSSGSETRFKPRLQQGRVEQPPRSQVRGPPPILQMISQPLPRACEEILGCRSTATSRAAAKSADSTRGCGLFSAGHRSRARRSSVITVV
jgi:hypothetical protein